MRSLLIAAHLLGFVVWIGAGLSVMQVGLAMRGAGREETALLLGIMGRLYRVLLLPGSLLTVISGLLLSLRMYGGAVSAAGYPPALMVMQGAGLLAAGLAFAVSFPTHARLSRLDPTGPHAPVFEKLRTRARVSGAVMGLLGLTALIAGALLR